MVPKVSIVVSTFNGERFLREAIGSLLHQTFSDFELIVVNDGSTDETESVLDSIRDPRVVRLRNDRNLGISVSQNRALASAKGELIALQDHDDVSRADRLQLQVTFLDTHPEVALVGSGCSVISEDGATIDRWTLPGSDIDIKWRLLLRNSFFHTTVVIRRGALDRGGGYAEGPAFRFAEDYELLSRLAAINGGANLSEPLVHWRQHPAQASSRNQQTQDENAARISLRNISAVLGTKFVDDATLTTVKTLLMKPATEAITISSDDVRRACAFLALLRKEFYRKHGFPSAEIVRHRRRTAWLWGKHLLALAYRRNGKKSLACRAVLLGQVIKVFSSLVVRVESSAQESVPLTQRVPL